MKEKGPAPMARGLLSENKAVDFRRGVWYHANKKRALPVSGRPGIGSRKMTATLAEGGHFSLLI